MSRPRIRSLKPELWQDEKVGSLSRDARLLFVGLVTMADDEGRLRALPALILGHVFPYDADALRKVSAWLDEIASSGLIERYTVGGTPYVQIVGWSKHQVINRPTPSDLPPAPLTEGSLNPPGRLPDGSSLVRAQVGADRKGSEGRGIPPSPPRGNRKTDIAGFEETAVAWMASAGVTGERPQLVKAYRQSGPWRDGDAAAFRAFCRQHFPSLSVVRDLEAA